MQMFLATILQYLNSKDFLLINGKYSISSNEAAKFLTFFYTILMSKIVRLLG